MEDLTVDINELNEEKTGKNPAPEETQDKPCEEPKESLESQPKPATPEVDEATARKLKKEKRKVIVRNILIGALIIIIILLLLHRCGGDQVITDTIGKIFNTAVDDDANAIKETDVDAEVEKLNKKLEAGLMTVSLNKTPVFENGTAKGNLNLVNLEENNYPQLVEIYLLNKDADGNEVMGDMIYQSKLIPIGKAIQNAALDVELKAGTYHCMAVIMSVELIDENTAVPNGRVQTPVEITVLH